MQKQLKLTTPLGTFAFTFQDRGLDEHATVLKCDLETNLASRWEGVRLPRASGKSPDFPKVSRTSPEVPRLSAPHHKSQIASDLKPLSPNRKQFSPKCCLGQLKSHFQIARFVI